MSADSKTITEIISLIKNLDTWEEYKLLPRLLELLRPEPQDNALDSTIDDMAALFISDMTRGEAESFDEAWDEIGGWDETLENIWKKTTIAEELLSYKIRMVEVLREQLELLMIMMNDKNQLLGEQQHELESYISNNRVPQSTPRMLQRRAIGDAENRFAITTMADIMFRLKTGIINSARNLREILDIDVDNV
jgi:hypothetical protein